MSLPEISIRRHVLAWMISGVFVLLGIIGFQKIGIDKFPMVEFPILSITTSLEGANPEIIDSSITNIIENAVNTTPGIESIRSESSPGVSVVSVTFNLNKNIEVAFNEIQSKVSEVVQRLPKDVAPPAVRKVETNANAIMWLSLSGNRTIQQLNLYAANILKKKIETIDADPMDAVGSIGVSKVQLITYVVIPESASHLLSQMLYMFDYNIRQTSILGLVGAGGIGFYIINYIKFFEYGKAAIFMLVVLITVLVIDWVSVKIRDKYIIKSQHGMEVQTK